MIFQNKRKKRVFDPEPWMLFFQTKQKDGIVSLPVLSGSMVPLLKPGKRIKLVITTWRKCHIGNIIVFIEGKHLVAHRLLFKFSISNHVWLYQKGDQINLGYWINKQQIVGKVVNLEQEPGRFSPLKMIEPLNKGRFKAKLHFLKDLLGRLLLPIKGIKRWLIPKKTSAS